MLVYYSIVQAQAVLKELKYPERPKGAFRGQDMFMVLNVDGSYRRKKWVVWEEKGRHPDVVFEFLSHSTRKTDLVSKNGFMSALSKCMSITALII